MTHKSAEQIRLEYLKKMGTALGETYTELWNEVTWLHAKWDEYVVLFGTKPSRIELLNRAAPRFFHIVQTAFFEETILHIARLTDAPRTAGKENLSVRRLPELISDTRLKTNVTRLVEKARSESEFCRDWRNRRIAHTDLKLALKQEATPLSAASRAKIKNALTALAAVLNEVSGHYLNSETLFDHCIKNDGAVDLLYILDDGLSKAAERKKRLACRIYTKEDTAPRDL